MSLFDRILMGLAEMNDAIAEAEEAVQAHTKPWKDEPTDRQPRKCGNWTALSDCETRDCFVHYSQKRRWERAHINCR